MWFTFAVIALLCWSGSDLFSKIGCQSETDKYSHLKMVTAVGVVMGLHACYEIFIGGVEISWSVILTYLPVSILYILSMAIGYVGLRYIELSISSPICNSSGAVVAVLTFATVGISDDLPPVALVAVALVFSTVLTLTFLGVCGRSFFLSRQPHNSSGSTATTASTLKFFMIVCNIYNNMCIKSKGTILILFP